MSVRTLKIKIKSLAAEAAIIRREERKALGSARWHRKREYLSHNCPNVYDQVATNTAYTEYDSLHNHRVVDVRQEARCSLLAYGFLRGRKLVEIETNVDLPYIRDQQANWCRVLKIAWRFYVGDDAFEELRENFVLWVKSASSAQDQGGSLYMTRYIKDDKTRRQRV